MLRDTAPLESSMRKWTDEEIVFLRENYLQLSYKDLALRLGRTERSIDNKLCKLGISKDRHQYRIDNKQTRLTIGSRKRANNKYNAILCRTRGYGNRKNDKYRGVEVKVSRSEFIEWYMPRDFEGASVDRIDPAKGYELSNMQVIPMSHNASKDKVKASDGMCECRVCHEVKPLDQFVKDNRRLNGHSTICKSCDALRSKTRYRRMKDGSTGE